LSRTYALELYPRAIFDGSTVLEHVALMSHQLNRALYPDETVHHKNGIRSDNRPDNLELWASNHPKGQRVSDLLAWAAEIQKRYNFIGCSEACPTLRRCEA